MGRADEEGRTREEEVARMTAGAMRRARCGEGREIAMSRRGMPL